MLPILALIQNVLAFNMPSRRFINSNVLRMSEVSAPVEENAFSPSSFQVFLGNLPFAMDESGLEELIGGRAVRYWSDVTFCIENSRNTI